MARQVKQFRYYGETEEKKKKNYGGTSYDSLTTGTVFENCPSIIQLGIQSLPGTKFYVNGCYNPVIVGTTGIYELDLNGLSEIVSLSFSGESIRQIQNNNTSLIIDILYEDGEN